MYSIENYKDYNVYVLNGISLRGFERNHLQIHLYASIQMYFYMLTLTTRLYIPIHPIYSNYNNYISTPQPQQKHGCFTSDKNSLRSQLSFKKTQKRSKNLISDSGWCDCRSRGEFPREIAVPQEVLQLTLAPSQG